jgi:hypothetical protein
MAMVTHKRTSTPQRHLYTEKRTGDDENANGRHYDHRAVN